MSVVFRKIYREYLGWMMMYVNFYCIFVFLLLMMYVMIVYVFVKFVESVMYSTTALTVVVFDLIIELRVIFFD